MGFLINDNLSTFFDFFQSFLNVFIVLIETILKCEVIRLIAVLFHGQSLYKIRFIQPRFHSNILL